jgi:hypothetical protein
MAVTINASTTAGLVNTADTSGVLALQTAGTTAVTVDASQNVGIGTASPGYKLDVSGNARVYAASAGANNMYFGAGRSTDYVFLDALGYPTASDGYTIFGIRAYSSLVSSTVQVGNTQFAHEGAGTDNKAYYSISTHNGTTLGERMRVSAAGELLVGTTSVYSAPKMALAFSSAVNNGLVFYQTNNSTGTFINFFSNSTTQQGSIINNNNGTVNYANASDYRLKENIVDFDENGLNLINNVKVRKFNRKEYPDATITGFIAHELAEVCPQAVCGEKDAVNEDGSIKAQSVDQSYLVPFLVKAIQEMKAIIDTQASTITQLQADVAALKGTTP